VGRLLDGRRRVDHVDDGALRALVRHRLQAGVDELDTALDLRRTTRQRHHQHQRCDRVPAPIRHAHVVSARRSVGENSGLFISAF